MNVAVITGASRGIGAATARLFAEKGYAVIINYTKSEELAERLVSALRAEGREALAVGADVSVADGASRLIETALSTYGRVDVLVNNAGVSLRKLVQDTTDEDYSRVFEINMRGVFNCCRAVIPSMVSAKSGVIINVGSIFGRTGGSFECVYSASKAAVAGFTRALAKELGPSGIAVNCVEPGFIATEMNAELDEAAVAEIADSTPLGRVGTPEDVAKAVFALSECSFITGQSLGVDGGAIF